ncbi:MAG: hypothetical protein KAI72_04030 [Candidatus Pacebacteria bacterium]|nr:hypothetical protein [Candidatus Paceibacterota bacterium]
MIDIFSYLTLLVLVFVLFVSWFLAFFVFKNNPKSATNQIFTLLSLVTSLWLIAMYLAVVPVLFSHALLLTRLTVFLAVPQILLFYMLAHTLPSNKLQMSKKTLSFIFGLSALVMILTLSPYVFTDVQMVNGFLKQFVGPGMPVFFVFALFFSGATVYVLLKKMKYAQGIIRQQVRFVFFGIVIMLGLLIATILLPVMLFQNDFFVPFAPLYVLIFLLMTAYAIIKYKFLDIRLVVARTVFYTALIVVTAVIYTSVLFFATTYLFKYPMELEIILFAGILTTAIALSFGSLRLYIQKWTNKIFFKEDYNSEKLLSRLTHTMSRTIDLDVMTNAILNILIKEIKISQAAFLIVNESGIDVKNVSADEDKYKNQINDTLSQKLKKICFRETKGKIQLFIFRDMEEGEQKQLFRELGISVAIPVIVENDCVAILILDKKLSGEIYFQRDIDFLDLFASEAGIAIQNAKAYQEIKKLSEELEEKVWERTKELQASQVRELKKAQDVLSLKDEFVFIATHELRAPVTAIRMFLDLIPKKKESFSKEHQKKLDYIAQASDHLHHLINDILEIARSEASSFTVAVQPTNIVEIIDDEIKELSSTAEKKNIKVIFQAKDNFPKVMADPQKATEVITNLLSNAIKYNREDGTIKIGVLDQETEVLVEVKDTGHGIPKNQQEKIFQKFFRAASRETSDILGTGLGLFITRMLVEKMGGEISFTSVEGEGTTFAFSLPKVKDK